MANQDELIERIAALLRGWTLDKEHAEDLLRIVLPVIIVSGVEIKR